MSNQKKFLFGTACLVTSIVLIFIGVNTVAGKPDIPDGTFYLFTISLAFFITGIAILISKRGNETRSTQDSQQEEISLTENTHKQQRGKGTRDWGSTLIVALGILLASAILVPALIYLFVSLF
jgi:hypothetical protein